jgi:hypothetical protein
MFESSTRVYIASIFLATMMVHEDFTTILVRKSVASMCENAMITYNAIFMKTSHFHVTFFSLAPATFLALYYGSA